MNRIAKVEVVETHGEISRLKAQLIAQMIVDFYKNPENRAKYNAWAEERGCEKFEEESNGV